MAKKPTAPTLTPLRDYTETIKVEPPVTPPTVAPSPAAPASPLSPQDQRRFDATCRRLREIMVEAKRRHARGHIKIDLQVQDGNFLTDGHVYGDWWEVFE